MIERHDFTDERVWSDRQLVDYHNEMIDILDNDPMPRLAQQALRQLGIVKFEIEARVIDIVEDDDPELY